MISLFQFAPQDASIYYLTKIFGTMNGIIANPQASGGSSSSGASLSLLGTMFKTFNTTILAVGALVVLYVTIVGIMQTAQEGEFMGKKWSSLWVPVRMVLGIAALVPTGSGYSGIQLVMMWVIVQGIGAADTLWSTALSYVNIAGSPYANAMIPSANVYSSLSTLFQAMTCDAAARETRPNPTPNMQKGNYYCSPGNNPNDGFCGSTNNFDPNSGRYSLGPNGSCGTLTFCNSTTSCQNPNSLQCVSCLAQISALQGNSATPGIIPTLQAIANEFERADYTYRDFYSNSYAQPNNADWGWIYNYCSSQNPPIPQSFCCTLPTSPVTLALIANGQLKQTCKAPKSGNGNNTALFPEVDPKDPQNPSDDAVRIVYWPQHLQSIAGNGNFIDTVTNQYTQVVSDAVTTFIKTQSQSSNPFSGKLAEANNSGWIMAGSYYYAIAQMNNNNLSNAIPPINMTTMDPTNGAMVGYRNNYSAASTLVAAAGGANNPTSNTPALAGMGSLFSSTMTSIFSGFLNAAGQGNVNPLAGIQGLGMGLLITVEVLFPVVLVTTLALGIVSNLNFTVAGTGTWLPVGPALNLIYLIFIPAMFAFLAFLVGMGGLLAVYTPLIPYVVFTVGSIGWFITTIEAMVAGPLVALGILSPSGEHELLGQAKPALMIIFSVALRPSLMIFGLMAAMLLAVVAADLVNAAFWSVAQSIGTLDPIGFILFFCAYVTLLITVLNKCFSAIYILPQGVMRWIGGQGEQYGEAEALGEVKRGAEGAGHKLGGAGETGLRGVGEGAQRAGGREAERKEHNKQAERQAEKDKIKLGKGPSGGDQGGGGGTTH